LRVSCWTAVGFNRRREINALEPLIALKSAKSAKSIPQRFNHFPDQTTRRRASRRAPTEIINIYISIKTPLIEINDSEISNPHSGFLVCQPSVSTGGANANREASPRDRSTPQATSF
jgi:hypothetical protein